MAKTTFGKLWCTLCNIIMDLTWWQSPFWPTGLNMGPQAETPEGVYKQTMADLDCITAKSEHKHNLCNCQHICQQNTRKCIQTSHTWTHSENARLKALGEGCIHEYIVHYMHLVCICASWEPEDRFHKETPVLTGWGPGNPYHNAWRACTDSAQFTSQVWLSLA